MGKTARYCLYVFIIAFCIIAIIVGINAQFFNNKEIEEVPDINISNNVNNVINQNVDVANKFMQLFDNKLPQFKEYSNISKSDLSKNYLYIYSENPQLPNGPYTKKVDGKYDITAYLPVFNINSEVTNNFNTITSNYFVKIMNDLIVNEKNSNTNTNLSISFTANINENILSVAIIAKLKEADKPQKTMIQGYNYDLINNKEVKIMDVLTKNGVNIETANSKIQNVIKNADNSLYKKDLTNPIYSIDKVTNYILGRNGEVYVMYVYGNQTNTYTSEMDIIQF